VPLALARQRLLTATFPYYELKEPDHGPAGGFVYKRKQNNKGEEVGGIVPHVTLKSIANNEPPSEEVLVDRPEPVNSITRVSGPFCLEATIPTPVNWEGDGIEDSGALEAGEHGLFIDRMLEVLRRSPVLHLGGGKTVEFKGIRKPAKTLSLSAEAVVKKTPSPSPSPARGEGNALYEVELLGLDVFDPITMMVDHRKGDDVPAWFLDTDYNGLCFHVSQAFFPRTSAWDNLKRALKSTHEESVWDHLAGTVSASFEAGEHGQIAVKVIDDRGNELLVVKSLSEAIKKS
jgi:hypothetical protein